MTYNVLTGNWDCPWSINSKAYNIRRLRQDRDMKFQHTLREGNMVVDYFTNQVLIFAGTKSIIYYSLQQVQHKKKHY